MELFKGVISNCKKDVLSTTTGYTSGIIDTKDSLFSGKNVKGNIRGEIKTEHTHYIHFSIDGVSFRLEGDYVFENGDIVALYAENSGKGYHNVRFFKNFTRGFWVLPKQRTIFGEKISTIGSGIVVMIVLCVLIGLCFHFFVSYETISKSAQINIAVAISVVTGFYLILRMMKGVPKIVEENKMFIAAIKDAFSIEELQRLREQEKKD